MKKLLIYFTLILFAFASCKHKDKDKISTDLVNNPASATNDNKGKFAKFEFEEEFYNFGNVTSGEKVSHVFKFKNVGETDLVISDASASCGCTVPEFSKEPIPIGKEGQIKVTFNSEGKQGIQNKTITVLANTQPNAKILKFTCNVVDQK